MGAKSTALGYGTVAVALHWISAVLIVGMIPLGFLMQGAGDGIRIALYRAHVLVGGIVLLLTLARLLWKIVDTKPAPAPGLDGVHLRGMVAIHVLLYVVLLGLLASGVVLNVQSGLLDVLRGTSDGGIPELADFQARRAHGLMARVYIGLLLAHVGGVIVHQVRHGHTLSRMWPSPDSVDSGTSSMD